MKPNRREMLAAVGAAGTIAAAQPAHAQSPASAVDKNFRVRHGKIRQSVMGWCFKPMDAVTLAKHFEVEQRHLALAGGARAEHDKARVLALT